MTPSPILCTLKWLQNPTLKKLWNLSQITLTILADHVLFNFVLFSFLIFLFFQHQQFLCPLPFVSKLPGIGLNVTTYELE